MDLELIRKSIDQIDQELVSLLEKRMDLVNQVAAYKKESGKAVLDKEREEIVLDQVTSRVNNQEYTDTIRATFSDIMAQSRAYQRKKLEL